MAAVMRVINIIDKSTPEGIAQDGGGASDTLAMEQIASLYGCSEVVRSSILLVETAFDGDLEGLKGWVNKGFHIGI
jgi:hypothetical protein